MVDNKPYIVSCSLSWCGMEYNLQSCPNDQEHLQSKSSSLAQEVSAHLQSKELGCCQLRTLESLPQLNEMKFKKLTL
jgi:hypothetical protein